MDSRRIVIFDLDDTLLKSKAKIKLINKTTGRLVKELTPNQFNSFFGNKKYIIDYSEFESPGILAKSTLIDETFNEMKKSISKGVRVAILTARNSSLLVKEFIDSVGVEIPIEWVIAVNDPVFPHTGPVPLRKQKAIKDIAELGYNDIIFYDDNDDNLRFASEIDGYKGIRVKTIKVKA